MARFGSLGTQYFNNSGEPLVDGLIYFYESGTTTPKNTYADINQATANTNPVVLSASGRQPNIFFSGAARAILATSSNVQIEVRDPVGDTSTDLQFQPWLPSYSYEMDDIVLYDSVFYISLVNGNLGNTPDASPSDWEPFADYLIAGQSVVPNNEVALGDTPTGLKGLDMSDLGALMAGDGTEPVAFPLGNNGEILSVDDSEPSGLLWAPFSLLYNPGYEEFLASDTYAIPASAVYVYVEAIGGGGGGGSRAGSGAGAGGGGGGFNYGIFRATDLSGPVTVTIGAGGAGGSSASGSNGGNTTFGTYLTARGGSGGPDTTTPAASGDYIVAATTGVAGPGSWSSGGGAGGSNAAGGSCIKGGAGGGASAGSPSPGGTSLEGGDGGGGVASGTPNAGDQPGGGGGANFNGTGGAGGAGRVRVWSW